MESNINHRVLRSYSASFADKLLGVFFKNKSYILGGEIVGFSDLKQINYFILKLLFENWKSEIERLKSPYFDYENEEVQEAGQAYMNVLSRHIKIHKDDFASLLEEATYKSLLLVFSPYEYYMQEFSKPDSQQISVEDLRAIQKYVKINGHLLQAYIDRFQKDGIQAAFVEDAVRIFDEVCETIKEIPDDFDHYHKLFAEVVPLDLNEVYSQPDEVAAGEGDEVEEDENINKKFKSSQQTLLDTFGAERKEALNDIHEKRPIEGIRNNISINQRFMFEKDLFNGDKDEFEMVINYLDNCASRKEAMEFINENYVTKKNWDTEKEEVEEFFSVINRRFPE